MKLDSQKQNKLQTRGKVRLNMVIAPLGLVALIIVFTLMSPNFLAMNNVLNILRQGSINIIIAIGMTVVILTGGIDLSVGSLVALAACSMSQFHHVFGMNIWLAATIGILISIALGTLTGFFVSKGAIPPFIATLGMMGIARGVALIITSGYPSAGFPDDFRWIGRGALFGIPVLFLIAIVVVAIMTWMLKYTELGRSFYAVGGNEEATRYSGVRVDRIKIAAYTISAICCGIAAVVMASRINAAPPAAGDGYELDAIAAVVIGGASLSGGEGSALGTLLGALIMAVLKNGLNMLNVNPFVQTAVIGAVIIATVLIKNFGDQKAVKE